MNDNWRNDPDGIEFQEDMMVLEILMHKILRRIDELGLTEVADPDMVTYVREYADGRDDLHAAADGNTDVDRELQQWRVDLDVAAGR